MSINFTFKTTTNPKKKRPLLTIVEDTNNTNNPTKTNHSNINENDANHNILTNTTNGDEGIITKQSIEYFSNSLLEEKSKQDAVIQCSKKGWKDIIGEYRKKQQQQHDLIRNELISNQNNITTNSNNHDTPIDFSQFPDGSADSYTDVSVDDFGAALLRGMGWSGHGDSIGRTNKRFVEFVEVNPREGRLGLGATEEMLLKRLSNVQDNNNNNSSSDNNNGETQTKYTSDANKRVKVNATRSSAENL